MIIQRLLAACVGAPIVVAALVVLIAPAAARGEAAAQAEVRAEDRASVASCLDLVAQAAKRRTEALNKSQAEDDGEPKPEKIDPAEWLRHAGERAAIDETSCIGVVSTPCQQTYEGRSNVGSADCIRRELAVWDERLNESYKRWIDACGKPNVCAARRKFARAWLAARDARCALPWIEMQGSMAIPLTSACMLDATARQAIWLDGDAQ
ncbi:MAG TPA: lysozyme inhibitor LprI family protein [Xanthobacteraceae bacterium]|jgi:uncharacterized protein YecT (DUF1311 family)|nr:lysozyme inhibitor LprI family protein [Xanthobacteraceae bacterium]